eukprot:gene5927-9757_t
MSFGVGVLGVQTYIFSSFYDSEQFKLTPKKTVKEPEEHIKKEE